MEIDISTLQQELLNYLGTAWTNGNSAAMMDLSMIETASPEELIAIAHRFGFIEEEW